MSTVDRDVPDEILRSDPSRRAWAALGSVALIVFVGGVAYANSFLGTFLFDDVSNITTEAGPWNWSQLLLGDGRSLVIGSFRLNTWIGGLNPKYFHAFNLAIHLAAAITLFDLARRLLLTRPPGSLWNREAVGLATFIALIWVVHPLQTESVTYIVQRAEAMMGLFYLLTLDALACGAEAHRLGQRRRWLWYFAAVAFCVLGMNCKQVMVTAPLTALLLDRTCLETSWSTILRRRWGLYLGLLATWLLLGRSLLLAVAPADPAITAGFGTYGITASQYALSQPGVILHYLRLVVVPYPLCIDYRWPVATQWSTIVPATAALVALLLGSLWLLVRRPPLGFLAVSFFLILAPTSSVMPIADLAVEHRTYLALAPLVALVVIAVRAAIARVADAAAQRSLRRIVVLLGLGLVGGLTLLTVLRNIDYESERSMWSATLAINPKNARAHNNLAYAYQSSDDFEKAEHHYREALKLEPHAYIRLNNLGGFLLSQKRYEEAAELLELAILMNHGRAIVWRNLAGALVNLGDYDRAAECATKALELDPAMVAPRAILGRAREKQGRIAEAEQHFREGIKAKDAYSYNLLVSMLLAQKRYQEAADVLSDVAKLAPNDAVLFSDLAFALKNAGKTDEAAIALRQATKNDPLWPILLSEKAWKLATSETTRDRDGALATRLSRQALMGSDDRDPLMLDALAAAQAESGNFAEAAATAKLAKDRLIELDRKDWAALVDARMRLYADGKQYRGDRGFQKGRPK